MERPSNAVEGRRGARGDEFPYHCALAQVLELVDKLDLGSSANRREGSTPSLGTSVSRQSLHPGPAIDGPDCQALPC